jgi:Na+/melibiose symporter-like transporter
VTFALALVGIVYGLIRGNPDGWSSPGIVAAFAGGAVLLLAFLLIERRPPQPMLELRLFRNPALVGASVGAFAIGATLFSMLLYITLYLQDILGYSAFQTGLRFLPLSALILVVAPISGRASARVPLRALVGVGLALVAVGLGLWTVVGPSSGWTALLPGMIVAGIGSGLTNPALASAAVGTVDADRPGIGSGINNTLRQVGIAVGIAGLGAIFQGRVQSAFVEDLTARAPQLAGQASGLADAVTSGAGPQSLQAGGSGAGPAAAGAIRNALDAAFVSGLDRIVWVAAIAAALGALLSALLLGGRGVAAAEEHGDHGTGALGTSSTTAQALLGGRGGSELPPHG